MNPLPHAAAPRLVVAIGLTGGLLAAAESAHAVTLTFDYTYDTQGFFANADAKARLEEAGQFFSDLLIDDLDAIAPSGGNTWSASFFHPGTGNPQNISNPTIAADEIRVFAGGRDLGGSTLGRGGPGGFSSGGSTAWLNTVESRGEGNTEGGAADEVAMWGGAITFDTASTWNYSSAPPAGGENDFFSIALHELGHLLGFGISDSWDNLVNNDNEFIGPASVLVNGANVALEPDDAHWLNGTTSTIYPNGASQETAMDPNVISGTRKLFTDLDVAGLDDIGWTIVPEPSSLTALAIAGLALARRRR